MKKRSPFRVGKESRQEPAARVISFGRSRGEIQGKLTELRALLSEKGWPEGTAKTQGAAWPSGLPAIDQASGGFPMGGISEVTASCPSSGSGLLVQALLREARRARRYVGLVDGYDTFDPGSMEEELLAFLLWVRCRSAAQAIQSVDLLARDGNLSLLLLDLRENLPAELRRQPPGIWHRLQRVAEKSDIALVVLTSLPTVTSARLRFMLSHSLHLDVFEQIRAELLPTLHVEPIRSHSLEARKSG